MGKSEPTYNEAVTEIEDILQKIENGEMDVDELTTNVRRVSELLKICREKLHVTEKEVTRVLDEETQADED